ncbi:DUF2784 family protein [Mycobacterium simiae]|nr:DUF2784 family protein [Mycobacterium simiae]
MWIFLVGATIAAHVAFIGYVALGGIVALRWRWTMACHVLAVGWVVLSVAQRLDCPLTLLERCCWSTMSWRAAFARAYLGSDFWHSDAAPSRTPSRSQAFGDVSRAHRVGCHAAASSVR